MNKALIITSVASMVDQFLMPSMILLQDMGYEVHVACNLERGSTCDSQRIEELKLILQKKNIKFYQVDFERNVLKVSHHSQAYKQLLNIVSSQEYSIIHCHSPIGGLLGRLAVRRFRKKGTSVFYTAHGFHFYNGAPLKNWLMYYPVEKICAHWTDVLITINQEDYALARRKLKAKKIEYVPGVGINVASFANASVDRSAKRHEIGVPEDAILLLSVGELNENKNHQVIVKAIAKLKDPNVHYAIAGVGDKREYLLELAKELGVSNQLHLLGYRKDIPELNHASDVFCFPSFREGLGLAAIEAMACGLPILTSNVHGINDYSEDGVTGYKFAPVDVDGFAKAISALAEDKDLRLRMGNENKKRSYNYSVDKIIKEMQSIYEV